MDSSEELELHERFRNTYSVISAPAMRLLQERVLGCGLGGASYTDVSRARLMAEQLRLQPDSELLEVGAGAGWPGLFLAAETGCRVTLADLPLEGLLAARRRTDEMGVGARFVVASGTRLPFRPGVFDAVSHSDVLC